LLTDAAIATELDVSALPGFDSGSDKLIFFYFALGDVLKSLIQTTPLNEPFFTDFEAEFRPVPGFDDMTERYFDHPCSANAWERHQAFVESLSPVPSLLRVYCTRTRQQIIPERE
jgi:hypothetical protein